MQKKPGSEQLILDRDCVQVWAGVLDPAFCQDLIRNFELSRREHREVPSRLIELEMINRSLVHDAQQTVDWTDSTDRLMEIVSALAEQYRQKWDPLNMMPAEFVVEGFRMKCYRPGKHQFLTHVDAAHRGSATRFLAFLFYVNDSEAGTEFPLLDLTVAAVEGSVLIFPPNWQYPHRGIMPYQHSKYIISTYFHYAH
jgi:hypothetical protein